MTVIVSTAVLANSVLPPAVYHAHVGGSLKHSHQLDESEGSDFDHLAGHHHQDMPKRHAHRDDVESRRRHGEERRSFDIPAPHSHISIAGFEFSLPLRFDGQSDGPFSPVTDDTGIIDIVRLTDDFTTVPRIDVAFVVSVSPSSCLTISASADEDYARTRWIRGRADRVLLCDSARCQQPGVLLI